MKSRASTSLDELERRIVEQERRAAHAQAEYRRELDRATIALEHKEGIIRSLIDKVADVEEVRWETCYTLGNVHPDHIWKLDFENGFRNGSE